jgi:D-aminoacyl-tRNA deacylase
MKVVIQRVTRASVRVADEVLGEIGKGLVVLVGIAQGDTPDDIQYLVDKTINLRIFADAEGKFNLSALDVNGELLLVSQFTLLASTRKGRRPGFTDAAAPEEADRLFNQFVEQMRASGLKVATGRFQAHMLVEIHNDGPVTIIIDSRERLESRRG